MTIANMLLTEFEQEAKTTRKFLEQLPEDKLMWKPHEKSGLPDNSPCTSRVLPVGS